MTTESPTPERSRAGGPASPSPPGEPWQAPRTAPNPSRWRRNPSLYQINAETWIGRLRQEGHSVRTLAEIPDLELDGLEADGYDLVWIMGVWGKGPLGLTLARDNPEAHPQYEHALPGWEPADVVGSPFSVQDYHVSLRLGGEDALADLRRRLAARGMGLVLDFVPNHTARDHAWIRQHPDRYVSGPVELAESDPIRYFVAETDDGPRAIAYGKDPNFEGWIDTAQLNWRNPETREAMVHTLARIAGMCDGVRCDMAMLLLDGVFARTWPEAVAAFPDPSNPDWWPAGIDAAHAVHPDFLFIAEVYWGLEGRLLELGFDYTYDKALYDQLRGIDSGAIRAALELPYPYLTRSVHFIENHDEDPAIACMGAERVPGAATLAATLPGLRFFHEGQFDGRTVRLPVQLGRPNGAELDPELATFYQRLLDTIRHPVVRNGSWRPLEVTPAGADDPGYERVIAHAWEDGWMHPPHVVIVNLSAERAYARVRTNLMAVGGREVTLVDTLSHRRWEASGDELISEGIFVDYEPWEARVLRLETRSGGGEDASHA